MIKPIVTAVAPTMPVEAASKRADQHDRITQAAAQRAEQAAHTFEQSLGDARLLQHHAHEDEQRDRQQHFVGHDAEDALRQRAENAEVHQAKRVAEPRESQRHPGQRQRDRITGHQRHDDGHDHQNGEGVSQSHQRAPGSAFASACAARIACATPCSAISAANNGMSDFNTNTSGKPLDSCERSSTAQDRAA